MTLLVSVDEYQAVTGDTCDKGRLTSLLTYASSAILAEAHGQQIVAGSSTDTIVFNYEGRFYLPQRPVTAVASVTIDGELLDPTGYRWTAGGNRRHATIIRRCDGHDSSFRCAEATVTYSHGWAVVPGQIVMAIVAMVRSAIATDMGTRELVSKTIGGSTDQYATTDRTADMNVAGSTRALLDKLCGVDGFGSVSVGAVTADVTTTSSYVAPNTWR
jgi:hypothetical protein